MPICSRCFGIVIGAIYGSILNLFIIPTNTTLLFSVLFIIPLIVDGSTQLLGYRKSNNDLRFMTGILNGAGIAFLSHFLSYWITSLP